MTRRLSRLLPAVSAFALLGACATMEPMDDMATVAAATGAATAQPVAAPTTVEAYTQQAAPLSQLVDAIDIPYEQFTLDNGLTVVVHEDRKAPVVALSVWYDVGSKHEPAGKTGFAHLFEHLMFNGSENAPGDFFEPLQQVGATNFNGTTNADRTNYYETVPTAALDRALMLESDRMGYLLGAVTQEKLDNQIGVVQNEKRRGDNRPYGLLRYEVVENIFPRGHPYHHSTIGSMDDLSNATLDDVKQWFRDHYGPNNAVLVLAGDIDAAEARPMVEKWFGAIDRGPEVVHPDVPVPTLAANTEKVVKDQISTTRIYRMWPIPGSGSADNMTIELAAYALGGLASSRLDNALVRDQQVAVSVSSWTWSNEDAGVFIVQADVKPGTDRATVEAALDAEVANYIAGGPTAGELERSKVSIASGTISGLESTGGKAVTLAGGALYKDNPGQYAVDLQRMVAATPESVTAFLQRWLTKPRFALVYEPGERTEGGESRGGAAIPEDIGGLDAAALDYFCGAASCSDEQLADLSFQDRSQLPPVGQLTDLDFPDIERATLSNGMEVYFARRDAVPTVSVEVAFDAGFSADPRDALGTQSLMLELMEEGTTSLDSVALATVQEVLGADIGSSADGDWTTFELSALAPNLAPSLALLADYIRNPAFADSDLERVRAQQLNRIESELKNPQAMWQRAMAQVLFGEHPYAVPPSGTGDIDVVRGLSRGDLAAFHDTWLRPDNAKVFVVGDTTLAEVTAQLEGAFGSWAAPAAPLPAKNLDVAVPEARQRIVLIDRPNSPQSVLTAGRVLDVRGTDDNTALFASNEILGGSFLSRINMNLRETKGWSYGSRSFVQSAVDRLSYVVVAEIQADKTGASLLEIEKELTGYSGDNGVTAAELERTVNGNVRELPGQFETSGSVLNGLVNIVKYGRPDDYYETLAGKYEALTADTLGDLARENFSFGDLVFVIVGDADVVMPQLADLGYDVELRKASAD